MRPPCDEAVIESRSAASPCRAGQAGWILAATILGSSMAFIDGTVVNVALPALQKAFGASVLGVQWVIESYSLALAALLLVGGSMGDMFGRRRMFLLGVGFFAAASAYCGLSPNIGHLIAARAVQGIGAAFLVPGSLAIISASFEESQRGKAIGTWSGASAITTAIGPVLGGWLIQHLSWRWVFFLNLPLALAVIVISVWHVPESRSNLRGRIDWLGALAVTLGLTAVTSGLIESSRRGWKHPLVWATLVASVAGLVAFMFVEDKEALPMVPLTLFRSRAFSGANMLTLFLYAALSILVFVLPLNLIQVQGYSATAAGAAMLPFILLMFSLSRWSGGLVARYGARLPLVAGPSITAAGFLVCSIPSVGGSYWSTFFPAVVTVGLGMSLTVAPLTTVVMGSVDRDRVGTASGINNAVSRVAGVIAIAGLGAAMVASFSNHLNHRLSRMDLPDDVRAELRSNEIRMAALEPPGSVDVRAAVEIRNAIVESFVSSFRLIMWICCALAVISAVIGWRMIPGAKNYS
jgi:EmrB/QacA subfamily drug resistance transporter